MNLTQLYIKYPTQKACITHLERIRWGGTPYCPYCRSTNSSPIPNEQRYHCNTCNTSYSVTARTIFHKTKLDLQKWFYAIFLFLVAEKGLSSRQLSKALDVNKNTGWYLLKRIQRGLLQDSELLLRIFAEDEVNIQLFYKNNLSKYE